MKGLLATAALAVLPKIKVLEESRIDLVALAAKRVGGKLDDFIICLVHQSIPRLDNFGISSGKVRRRADAILRANPQMNRKEIFKTAVLDEVLERGSV